jgi:hypothetical protein
MKALLLVIATLLIAAPTARASTVENALFTCEGELTKTIGIDGKTYYATIASWNEDMPQDCGISEGAALRRVLAVCHVGDLCTVAAKGEEGNGNRYMIEKVF